MINLKVNYKLEKFFTTHKKIKVAIGGRSSGKSRGIGDLSVLKMHSEAADIYCLREYQESLDDSVHRVIKKAVVEDFGFTHWDIQNSTIIAPNGAKTKYKGAARNTNSIQSAQDYKYSWYEEAQVASQESLVKLLPTILRNKGAECWFSANPQSSEDPFSKRFILPFQDQLESQGYYEDDLHYVVVVNWRDNPWWDESQDMLRRHDFETMSRAKYDWIWEGKFNDSVEDALIKAEWFDACIDSHTKLGFKPVGGKFASHDPSDEGSDTKGYAMRHGVVVLDVQEMTAGTVNDGCDWACGLANNARVDSFTWDGDGMGIALPRQVSAAFNGTATKAVMFRGSESPDFPDSIYQPVESGILQDQKTNKDAFRNKRAQYYFELRDRMHRTYNAVERGVYSDPDTLISLSSKIPLLQKLRSEVCRLPVKPNASGRLELYTKPEMKSKFKISSPNLSDSIMMLFRQPHAVNSKVIMPPPIKQLGRR